MMDLMLPMQFSCDGASTTADAFASGDWVQTLICTFASAGSMSVAAFGLVIWGTVSTATYVRTQSMMMPMIYLLLLGSIALEMVPSVGTGVAAIVLVGGASGFILTMLRRLDRI